LGPDRIARLIRDLEEKGLQPASIRRYLVPLASIFKLAIRRGIVHTSPMALLSDEERATGGGLREHYIWSPAEISALIAAAEDLGRRSGARYNYAPLIHLLALTGLRVGEALGLRAQDVDLVEGVLHVRHSGGRNGAELNDPKTSAGKRTVGLSPGLVDLLAGVIDVDADPESFVFHAKDHPDRPVSYFNFRTRGFHKALEAAGLEGRGITLHSLRSGTVSLLYASGCTDIEVAAVIGHSDSAVTRRVYARIFDPEQAMARVRAAQASISRA
jgi:integrase